MRNIKERLTKLSVDIDDAGFSVEASELDSLVQDYEKILGKTLTSLRDRVEEVESTASLAILEAMAAS